jgi:hypothetical protein
MRFLLGLLSVAAALAVLAAAGTPASGGAGPDANASVAKKCNKKHFKSRKAKRRYRRHCKAGNGPSTGPAGSADDGCAKASSPARLAVSENEFSIGFSPKPPLACGTVIVQQQNVGMDGHDLVIQKEGSSSPSYRFPELAAGPGATASQTVNLTRGTWIFYCSLEGHRAVGMERTVAAG